MTSTSTSATTAFAPSSGCSFLQGRHCTARKTCHRSANSDADVSTAFLTFHPPSRIYATQATFSRPPSSNPRPRYPSRPSYNSNSSRPNNRENEPFQADPTATYYTECGVCTAVYEIDTEEIGARGRRVACEVCGNSWFQRVDRLRTLHSGKQFVDYPVDDKDKLIVKRRDARADYRARRAGASNEFAVFVGNLPYDAEETKLRELVSDTCEVASIVIVKDRETGRSKGFGFLNVSSDAEVRNIVDKYDGVQFNGRNLTMRAGNKN